MPTLTYDRALLVDRHRGTLPVLLACSHDGTEQPPGVPERSGKGLPTACAFRKSRDLRVADLARAVAQCLRDRTGEAPYVVTAAFHRKYIDANRTAACGVETGAARPFYKEYHATLRAFTDEIRAENGGTGLLLDLHGVVRRQDAPADIYLGTGEGLTITALRQGAGEDALHRRRGLAGLLQAAGYALHPGKAGQPEHPALTGGHTVETYGSHRPGGIDAIQLEIAAELRTDPARRAALAADLADAIASLLPRWLPSPRRQQAEVVPP
jgi:N-formylglutamate amidohydrolase